jgi:dipeptidyl-peptidase-4
MLPHGQFVDTSWRDGHTHLYLYRFDEKHPLDQDAVLVKQLTQGDYEVESVAAPRVNGEVPALFFASTEGSPLEDNLWSIRLDGTGKRKLTSMHGTHDTTVSPDGSQFSDQSSGLENPPSIQLCATAASTCSTVWSSKPFGPVAGVSVTLVQALASDGITTLYGRLVQPTQTMAASVPLILNPYGGPIPGASVRNTWGGVLFEFSELLAQHGFATLTFDNRGGGGRGRDFQQADFRNFGPVQLADQLAALDQTLAKNPQFDPKRIGWWGWSWGGTFALNAMTHTDRIRAGAAVAPVTDFRNYDSIYTERYLGLPAAEPQAYDAASVKASAAKLKGRVLIAEGTGDDNVHLGNTIQFLQPLIAAGIPYDLQLFPRLTHSINGQAARNQLFNRVLFHFETYLKPLP